MTSYPLSRPEDDPALRETLKRCSPDTYYAACKFRQSGQVEDLHIVITGVVERFVPRELRPKLHAGGEALRLREDLAIDSLTMMEIVMVAEEVLPISVTNEELTGLCTLGDMYRFVAAKVSPGPVTANPACVSGVNQGWDLATVGERVRRSETPNSSARASRVTNR